MQPLTQPVAAIDDLPAEAPSCANPAQVLATLAHNPRGMTLVEIMIVLTIMASIMGVGAVYAVGAMRQADIKKAQAEIGQLASQVTQFFVFRNQFPDSLDQLVNPPAGMARIRESVPKDPWGNDYVYRKTNNQTFTLLSMGPDGATGGGDDICPDNQECN